METLPDTRRFVRRHLGIGWWALLVFLTLDIFLEALHAFKAQFYLSAANEMRNLMWRLAHAHGTLLALVNVAFAATLHVIDPQEVRWQRTASACFLGATILLPGGFFLAGLYHYSGDPGLGILLVPVGALLLFTGVLMTALQARKASKSNT